MSNTITTVATDHALRWSERILLASAVVCLGIFSAAWIDAQLAQAYGGWQLEQALTAPVSSASTAASDGTTSAAPAPGAVIGKVDIPRIGVSAVIFEGVDTERLRQGVGHIPGTALPGRDGNVALAGHRDTFFRGLRQIQPGDLIKLTSPEAELVYEVDTTAVVEPQATHVLDERDGQTLTLVTCFPFGYVGPAPKRFVVFAHLLTDL